jgi:hypothetical protein
MWPFDGEVEAPLTLAAYALLSINRDDFQLYRWSKYELL